MTRAAARRTADSSGVRLDTRELKGWEPGERSVSGFDVDPEMLREHAAHIDAIVDEFILAGNAMKKIAAADNAYGTFCEWIPPILATRATEQDRITGKLAKNLRVMADAVRDAADAYEQSDEDARLEFESFEEDRGGR